MLLDTFFLQHFAFFMKMCSPPRQEAHFRKTNFANIVCKTKLPCPKWSQNQHFWGAFPSCAVQEIRIFADWAENGPSWEALFSMTCIVACLLGQIFIFSLLLLLLFLFPAQLITIKKSTIPSPILHCMFSFAHLQLCAETKIEGRRCCPPQRAFN